MDGSHNALKVISSSSSVGIDRTDEFDCFCDSGVSQNCLEQPDSTELLSIQSPINYLGRNHREKGACGFVLCVYTLIHTHLVARTHPFLASRNRDGERYRDPRSCPFLPLYFGDRCFLLCCAAEHPKIGVPPLQSSIDRSTPKIPSCVARWTGRGASLRAS
jgi:hypothetical protein